MVKYFLTYFIKSLVHRDDTDMSNFVCFCITMYYAFYKKQH